MPAWSILRLAGAPRAGLVLLDPPATHVVRGGDDAGADALGAPGRDHEVPDPGRDPDQTVLLDAELLGVLTGGSTAGGGG